MQRFLMIITLCLLISIPICWLLLQSLLLQPLNSLTETTQAIKTGHTDTRVPRDSNIYEVNAIAETVNTMLDTIQQQKIEAYEWELSVRDLRLQYLQLQLRPHFFLNCLNLIYSLAGEKKYADLQELALNLSIYLRNNFKDSSRLVTLTSEINSVESYIHIQGTGMQFPPLLEVFVDFNTDEFLIPPISVLTFVENAVKHATPEDAALEIHIKCELLYSEEGNYLNITICDNGCGFSQEKLKELAVRREALEAKLAAELGPEPFRPVKLAKTTARALPLGVLFHIAPGNMPGLPVYTALEGLLTGNINLIKLPHGDKGLSLAAFQLLAEQEPRLAPYLYAFDLSSGQREELDALAALADGMVAWGGDGAIEAARTLAGPGCKLIEWGHRLSFAYVSGYEDREGELSSLAAHIVDTGQRLCSSCQVIFLDTGNWEEGAAFCRDFLPYLERAAAKRPGPSGGASASLSGHTALLERVADGRAAGEALFRGKGCSAVLRPGRELELSPMEGNVLVKLLPQVELLPALRRGCCATPGSGRSWPNCWPGRA